MTSDVVLSAAMRNNLLSLQSTSNSIDISQTRLSTGKKINSALDGPQAFFASQALTNRAADLTKLLDSVGQSIQIIKAADNGITALTSLVEQADSIATQAQDALAAGTSEAKVTGNVDLRGIDDMDDVPGVTAGSVMTLSATKQDGTEIDVNGTGVTTIDINISGKSIDEIITAINGVRDASDQSAVFEAKLDDKGHLSIRTVNGANYSASFSTGATDDAESLGLANALGFGKAARLINNGATDGGTPAASLNEVSFTAIAGVALTSHSFVKSDDGDVADRSTSLMDLRLDSDPAAVAANRPFVGIGAGDVYTIGVNGGAALDINLAGATIQSFIDDINNDANLGSKLQASYDEGTGQISIRALDPSVTSVQIGFKGSAANDAANFGFGLTDMATSTANLAVEENISIGSAAGQLAKLEQDFNKIRDQMTQLVENGDTGYRGTNLLNGNNLLTVFNENRTSSIETEGVTFTADGLGLKEADFARAETVNAALTQVRDALTAVREFGSTLANDLSVIQTRQTFINSTINTLKEGSDKLVNADQNEEGAKLLALQTRQSLGVTALSLASQSQQSILRLF